MRSSMMKHPARRYEFGSLASELLLEKAAQCLPDLVILIGVLR